jgi:hypothetical protein
MRKRTEGGSHDLREKFATPCTLRTDNNLKIRFSATLGEEPDIDVELA